MKKDKRLTKVIVHLPNHWYLKGESLWARALGRGLYEIKSIPFLAYDLNLGDVVRAKADSPDLKPEIRSLVRRSGNRTIRIIFNTTEQKRNQLLGVLKKMGVRHEGMNEGRYVTLNIPPDADYEAIEEKLKDVRRRKVLSYETCEPREVRSYDAAPPGKKRR